MAQLNTKSVHWIQWTDAMPNGWAEERVGLVKKEDASAIMSMVHQLIHAEFNRALAVKGLVRRTTEGIMGTATPVRSSEFTKEDWSYIYELTDQRDAHYLQIKAKLNELIDR